MKFIYLILSLVTFYVKAQTVDSYKNNFTNICNDYKKNIFEISICENTINALSALESKISESLFFDKTLIAEDKNTLKNLNANAIAVRRYIGYQQACGQEYFTFEELKKASTILGATYEEVFVDKHCMKIIKTELNGYVSYLAENTANEHKKFNFKYKRIPYGIGQGETEIQAKGIKDLYNNKTEKNIKTIELVYFNCL